MSGLELEPDERGLMPSSVASEMSGLELEPDGNIVNKRSCITLDSLIGNKRKANEGSSGSGAPIGVSVVCIVNRHLQHNRNQVYQPKMKLVMMAYLHKEGLEFVEVTLSVFRSCWLLLTC
jgi:hypothetical protein